MKKPWLKLCFAMIGSLWFAGSVFAAATTIAAKSVPMPTSGYLMWQIPSYDATKFPHNLFPMYVYSNGKQIAYIPSGASQTFVGAYNSSTSGTYQLYYQDSHTQWHSCTIAIVNGVISGASTCQGSQLNPPASYPTNSESPVAWSNVWTVGPGAYVFPVSAAPANPQQTNYANRTITFQNNTQYAAITIGGSSCGFSLPYVSGKNACAANSTVKSNYLATIVKGASYSIAVGTSGLNSAAYYVTGYCTGSATDCFTSTPDNDPKHIWVKTGGYGVGETPYAVKIEPTILPVVPTTINGQIVNVPGGASNIDMSAVDGYNFGAILYPSSPAYCVSTVPPEDSQLNGGGFYSINSPLAKVVPTTSTSLQSLCALSSQLPENYSGSEEPWNLSILNDKSIFAGCMSPCNYATKKYGVGSDQYNQFCCKGSYNTPESCDVAPGQIGANTSTYTTNVLNSPEFQNVYPFAFGDAGNDYGCPPETNFVVSFVSTNTPPPPTNPITFTSAAASNVTQTSATITFATQDTDPKAGNISYTYSINNAAPQTATSPANLTGLLPSTNYSVVITATDQDKNTATSSPVVFTTAGPTDTITAPTNVAANSVTKTRAVLSWSASTDSLSKPISYTVNISPAPLIVPQATNALSLSLPANSLVPNTAYSVTVTASDGAVTATSTPIQFTTAAAPAGVLSQPTGLQVTRMPFSGTVTWNATAMTYNGQNIPDINNITWTATSAQIGSGVINNNQPPATWTLGRFMSGAVTITATYSGVLNNNGTTVSSATIQMPAG